MRECEFRKNNLRPGTLWSGSKPSCIKRQALVLLAWTSVMLGRPGCDTTDEKQDRQHWVRTESAR